MASVILGRRALMLVVLALASTLDLAADVRITSLQEPVSLAGTWSFQEGDDLAWANPGLDDAGWEKLQVPLDWGRQGHHGYAGLAWYRLVVRFPAVSPSLDKDLDHLAVTVGKVHSAYELYAGGRWVGGVGALPPAPRIVYDKYATHEIPRAAIDPEGRLVLALRVWRTERPARRWEGGPYEGPFLIGTSPQLARHALSSQQVPLITGVLYVLVGLYHLHLYRRRGELAEYLWFGLMVMWIGTYGLLVSQWKHEMPLGYVTLKKLEHGLLYSMPAIVLQFLWRLLSIRPGRLLRLYQASFLVLAALVVSVPGLSIHFRTLSIWQLWVLPTVVGAIVLVAWQAWRGHPEARTVLIGVVVFAAVTLNDLAVDQRLLATPRLVPIGFAVFILSMALSLANRVTRLFAEVEGANRNLEGRVAERTRELAEANQRLEEAVRLDPLTQLANRRAFLERAEEEIVRFRRSGRPFSIVLSDIDHFKRFNDTHGHACGDYVLREAARTLRASVREQDVLARWGGEEFIILLPETDAAGAALTADRSREVVAGTSYAHEGQALRVSMTFGVSEYRTGMSPGGLRERRRPRALRGQGGGAEPGGGVGAVRVIPPVARRPAGGLRDQRP